MLKSISFPAGSLQSVASQLSREPSHVTLDSLQQGNPVELAESFDVYELNVDAPPEAGSRWRDALKETGQWHHQIRHASDSSEFALSAPREAAPDDRLVLVTFSSDLARKVDATIDWLDRHQNLVPDGTVHVVFISALSTHIFWIEAKDDDFVVAIDYPDALRGLDRERFYRGEEFLKILNAVSRDHAFPPPP